MDCPTCNGSSYWRPWPGETHNCPVCGGRRNLPDDPQRNIVCPECGAAGSLEVEGEHDYNRKICKTCHGRGFLYSTQPAPIDSEALLALFFQAGEPRTAHLRLEGLFADLSGPIAICDPYYGSGSLARLDLLEACRPIRFLTWKPDSAEKTTIATKLKEWKVQHGAVEFRRVAKGDLHDRYVLSLDSLVIVGHGLKDVGQKDSFAIKMTKDSAQDMLDSVKASFNAKWAIANPIV